ncbi:MAG: sulfatase-like hydrolase/transferase [Planctomycetota bacterium]
MVSPNRPNVLFINTDQLRADFLSCYGFPVETTPNIDRLAREGMRFDSTFCQSPICVPSRYSLSTGLYPSSHCAYTNRHAPYPSTRSLLQDFNDNGYHTVAIGKLHHNPPDANFGFEEVHLHDGTFRSRRKYSVYSKWLKEQGVDEDKLAYPPDIDSNPEKRPYKDTIHWGRCQLPDEYC